MRELQVGQIQDTIILCIGGETFGLLFSMIDYYFRYVSFLVNILIKNPFFPYKSDIFPVWREYILKGLFEKFRAHHNKSNVILTVLNDIVRMKVLLDKTKSDDRSSTVPIYNVHLLIHPDV
ncbi:hypothetical protein BDC45DRAFT_557623 [Circinella umbellata]|nr:hypothetical protein BDC45DRAFT_557623 [Circinella umbellata]